jgi:hypothetical protein
MTKSPSGFTTTRQRDLANLRERRRMMLINRGFEQLKGRLPLSDLVGHGNIDTSCRRQQQPNQQQQQRQRDTTSTRQPPTRLTKVDILRLAIQYINQLKALLVDGQAAPAGGDRLTLAYSTLERANYKQQLGHTGANQCRLNKRKRLEHKRRSRRVVGDSLDGGDESMQSCDEIAAGSELAIGQNVPTTPQRSTTSLPKVELCNQSSVIYFQCSGGRTYSLTWSRSRQSHGFFVDEQDTLSADLGAAAWMKRVLRNTKLWVPAIV